MDAGPNQSHASSNPNATTSNHREKRKIKIHHRHRNGRHAFERGPMITTVTEHTTQDQTKQHRHTLTTETCRTLHPRNTAGLPQTKQYPPPTFSLTPCVWVKPCCVVGNPLCAEPRPRSACEYRCGGEFGSMVCVWVVYALVLRVFLASLAVDLTALCWSFRAPLFCGAVVSGHGSRCPSDGRSDRC